MHTFLMLMVCSSVLPCEKQNPCKAAIVLSITDVCNVLLLVLSLTVAASLWSDGATHLGFRTFKGLRGLKVTLDLHRLEQNDQPI